MQVLNCNFTPKNIQYSQHYSVKTTQNSVAFKGIKKTLATDTVELGATLYRKGLEKLHDMTKAEYDTLTDVEKNLLREKIEDPRGTTLNSTVKKDIAYHHFATEAIRQVFDKQYGEGNYVVITLGRSLSSISKLLGMKIGTENVKNIPMSGIFRHWTNGRSWESYNYTLNCFKDKSGISKFKKYLSSIGLSKNEVENSGKNYVIMDFTSSGQSLESGYITLTSDFLLGNKKRNITYASMFDVSKATGKNLETNILDYYYLEAGLFKKYSFVDKLNDFNRISMATNIEEFTPIPAHLECKKLFGFGLLDSMYSGKKIPYSDAFDIDCSGSKYRKIWNSYQQQFKQDTFEDSLEILKLIHKTSDYTEIDDYVQYLRDMDYDYRYALKPWQVRSEMYYSEFRPKLLSLIEAEQK